MIIIDKSNNYSLWVYPCQNATPVKMHVFKKVQSFASLTSKMCYTASKVCILHSLKFRKGGERFWRFRSHIELGHYMVKSGAYLSDSQISFGVLSLKADIVS